MSLLWVKLADRCDKSMVSGRIGYLLLYFSEKVALTSHLISIILSGFAKAQPQNLTCH